MRIRRHLPPLAQWRIRERGKALLAQFGRSPSRGWIAGVAGAALAGYLVAYLILFPSPILAGHTTVPRVLGLTRSEAQSQLDRVKMKGRDGGTEPHPTAQAGTVIWQDPPPGVLAPEGATVTLVTSGGAAKIPVPDLTGDDGVLAQKILQAAGLTLTRVESLPGSAPPGVTMLTRPPAGTFLAPGGAVILVVSQGAATIAVPDLLSMSLADARTRLELEGLQVGTVTRRRTSDASPGTVVAQKPAAGTLAAPGTVVDIVIARTPQ